MPPLLRAHRLINKVPGPIDIRSPAEGAAVVFKRRVQGYVADRPQAAIGLIAQGRAGRDVWATVLGRPQPAGIVPAA